MFKLGIHVPGPVRPRTKSSDAIIIDPWFKIDQLSAAYDGYQKPLVYHRPQNHLVIVCQANTHQQWARSEGALESVRNNRAKTKHLKVKLWCNMDKLTLHIEFRIVPKGRMSKLVTKNFCHQWHLSPTSSFRKFWLNKGVKHREALREKRLSITCAILSIAYILCWIPFSLSQDSLRTSDLRPRLRDGQSMDDPISPGLS